MNLLETLRYGRALISSPERWTQHESARDAKGNYVFPVQDNAVCWCSTGVLDKIGGSCRIDAIEELSTTSFKVANTEIVKYNDTHSHTEVLAVWDATIKRLEGL